MVRIAEHRSALPNGPVVEVYVRLDASANPPVVASVNISVFGKDPDPGAFVARLPVDEAFLLALAYAERAWITVVWIDDPCHCFPPEKRPAKDVGSE